MTEYRRLFIIRKDLSLSHGKMAAMVSHCSEAYWLNLIRDSIRLDYEDGQTVMFAGFLDKDVYENYVNGSIVKTICEAKNLNQLRKAEVIANELGLILNKDYGYINDLCLTELKAENDDGTCTIGMWFKPLPTDMAHQISKKFQLYKN